MSSVRPAIEGRFAAVNLKLGWLLAIGGIAVMYLPLYWWRQTRDPLPQV